MSVDFLRSDVASSDPNMVDFTYLLTTVSAGYWFELFREKQTMRCQECSCRE